MGVRGGEKERNGSKTLEAGDEPVVWVVWLTNDEFHI